MNTIKNSFISMLDSFQPGSISRVLFTSFNFSPDFFERNVLPLIVDRDTTELDPLQLNNALSEIDVTVVCDQATAPSGKGNLRYGLLPVSLDSGLGLFHPKLILVEGKSKTEVTERKSYKLLVGSCNLTLSGWGLNREVAAVCDVTKQQAQALTPLLEWLESKAGESVVLETLENIKEEGNVRQNLGALKKGLENIQLPERSPYLYVRLPDNKLSQSGFNNFMERVLGGFAPIKELTVISPFWSEARDWEYLTDKAQKVNLIPSLNLKGEYSLPESWQKQLQDPINKFFLKQFEKDAAQYTHAKALFVESEDGKDTRLIIGSANFTSAAWWNENQGNAEAVLVYDRIDSTDFLKQFKLLIHANEQFSEDGESEEHAPKKYPFVMRVFYDWSQKKLILDLEIPEKKLPNIKREIPKLRASVTWREQGEGKYSAELDYKCSSPLYSLDIEYLDEVQAEKKETEKYKVLVTQLNATDDQLGYSPKPSLKKLVEQLRSLNPSKGAGKNAGQWTLEGEGDRDEEGQHEIDYDFFSLFQATYKLKESYSTGAYRDKNPFDQRAPFSLALLYRALQVEFETVDRLKDTQLTSALFIRHYLSLCELLSACRELSDLPKADDKEHIKESIEAELEQHQDRFIGLLERSSMLSSLTNRRNVSKSDLAAAVFEWFKEQVGVAA